MKDDIVWSEWATPLVTMIVLSIGLNIARYVEVQCFLSNSPFEDPVNHFSHLRVWVHTEPIEFDFRVTMPDFAVWLMLEYIHRFSMQIPHGW